MILPDQVLRVTVGGIDIAYETFGDQADPPVVLVAGLGSQLLSWPEGFCHDWSTVVIL